MKIRNILLSIAAILTLLLLCFFLYYRFTLHKANAVPIHNNASWMIKIDGEAIAKILWKELLLDGTKGNKPSDTTSYNLTKGLSVPLMMYIYNTRENPSSFFTSVPLRNKQIVSDNLKDIDSWEPVDTYSNIYKYRSAPVYITYNENYALFGWNLKDGNALQQLWDLAHNPKKVMGYNQTPFYETLKDKGALAASNLKDLIAISFEEDAITIKGNLDWQQNEAIIPVHIEQQKSGAAYACLHTGTDLNWETIVKFVPEVDSFIHTLLPPQHTNCCIVADTTLVTYYDTAITYEYDENFEKTAVATTTKHQAPKILAGFGNTAKLEYFAIRNTHTIDKKYFPSGTLYFQYINPGVLLSNDSTFTAVLTSSQPDCAFQLHSNFSQLGSVPYFKKVAAYLKLAQDIQINGSYQDKNTVKISGSINFVPQKQNALKIIYRTIRSRND